MTTSVTIDTTRVNQIDPFLVALGTILDSTVVPGAVRRAVTVRTVPTGAAITSVVVTFPDETAADQIANFTRRVVAESTLLKGALEQFPYASAPAGQTY